MPMLITRVDSSKPPMKLQGLRGVNPSIYLGLTIANVASFHAIKFHSLLPRALSSPIIFLFYCYIRGTRGAAVFSETSNRPEKHRGGGVSFAWEMEGRKEGRKRVVERRSKWLFWKKVGILFFFSLHKFFKILEFVICSSSIGVGCRSIENRAKENLFLEQNEITRMIWFRLIQFQNFLLRFYKRNFIFLYTRDTIPRWKGEESMAQGKVIRQKLNNIILRNSS